MRAIHGAFWDDLDHDLQSRRFRVAYRWSLLRIAAVDLAVNALRQFSRLREREG